MNNKKKNIFAGALSLIFGLALTSCADETPFSNVGQGDSTVSFSVSVNETVTRGVSDTESGSLLQNLVLQITDDKGMLFNWKGYESIPTEGVAFKYGEYWASASAGDSVAASFDKRYFKGQTSFSVSQNQIKTQVTVICRVANVVVSIDASDVDEKFLKDLKVVFSTSNGSLEFNNSNLASQGYFMRSFDNQSGKYEDVISYTVTGKDKDGETFSKTGKISGVQPAHGYTLKILSNEKDETTGGLSLRLQIQEYSLISDSVVLEGHPEFKWEESSILKNGQISGTEETFTDQTLVVGAYSELKSLILASNDQNIIEAFNQNIPIDLTLAPYSVQRELKDLGIEYEKAYINSSENTYIKYTLTLKENWLKSLPVSQDEYLISLTAVDNREYANMANIRIANSSSAIAPPFEIIDDFWKRDYLSVRAHSAQVKINMMEGAEEVSNPMLQYRKVGEEDWQSVNLTDLSKGEKIVTIKNLEAEVYPNPGVTYECRLVGGDIVEDDYQYRTKELKTFATETIFEIPNGNMENWYSNGKIVMPNEQGTAFWDTGNHGSSMMNKTLTDKSNDYVGSPTYSAKLQSQYVGLGGIVGKFAAGNLFVGQYLENVGTDGAKLTFGQPFNNSHPRALRVLVKYSRGAINYLADNCPDKTIKKNETMDLGHIFIAIASGVSNLNTAVGNMFDPQGKNILGYGEKIFDEDWGENELKEVIIDIDYNSYSNSDRVEPNTIILVCSASKYGDYFTGSSSSVMYVDDFKLIYDDIE